MLNARAAAVFLLAGVLFAACALSPWHPDPAVRSATGMVLATLLLWISEAAPLGIVALGVPVAATFTGLLTWPAATAAWGDPILFLFLGGFLLARALEKYGAFDVLLRMDWLRRSAERPLLLIFGVIMLAGVVSLAQNNTAVTALLLPLVLHLARRSHVPSLPLLALAYGATFGGVCTPVGTAPNMIGFEALKRIDPQANFLSWMMVGAPVWLGATAIGWAVLSLARRWANVRQTPLEIAEAWPPESIGAAAAAGAEASVTGAAADEASARRLGRRFAVTVFLLTAAVWLLAGVILSASPVGSPSHLFVKRYLPESLVPVVAAALLFFVRVDARGRTVLDRGDLQRIDWDTLFLIAGGLSLGRVLDESGAAHALAGVVAGLHWPPVALLLVLAGVTVLLSELTSNTATAALLVPIAGALAQEAGLPPERAVVLVALSASLGFALPISTPPNAIVYGTRLIPLRVMACTGLAVDVLCIFWVVFCVSWLT